MNSFIKLISQALSIGATASLVLTAPCSTFAASSSSAMSFVNKHVLEAHVALDEKLATLYSGQCPNKSKMTASQEATLERRYFPFAAHKLIKFNSCEADVFETLVSTEAGNLFAKRVVDDIAIKLPTLRKLNALAAGLKSKLDKDLREQFSNDAQMARFGFLDASQIAQQKVRSREMVRLKADLEATLKTEKSLIASIWRANDKVMGDYLTSLIQSKTPVEVFKREAMLPNPRRPLRYFKDAYSFRESVLLPMITESRKLVDTLKSDYVTTPDGKTRFEPGFSVRNVLVDNMDLVIDVDEGPQTLKDLQCHLDYKYAKGDDDLGTTISVLTMMTGPAIKGLSLALRAAKLETLWQTSAVARKLGFVFAGGAGAYGFTMTAESAVEACRTSLEHLDDGKIKCDSHTSASDLSQLEGREIDKGNCGLMIVSSVLTEAGFSQIGKHLSSIFASNPELKTQILSAQTKAVATLKLKDQEQVVQGNVETAKDVKDIVSPPKDEDSKDDDAKSPGKDADGDDKEDK